MKEELQNWLKEIGEIKSSSFISECTIDANYVDTLFELHGDKILEQYDIQIGVPGKYYNRLKHEYVNEIEIIEKNIKEIELGKGNHIRQVTYHPQVQKDDIMSTKKISIITRQSIFDEITISRISWSGRLEEPDFLARIFDLQKLPSKDSRYTNAYDDIHKHRVMNYDWEDDWIFTESRFNLLHCDEGKLLQFICLTIHPVARRDEEGINQLINIYNRNLLNDGYEIYEKSKISGAPVYGAREITTDAVATTEERKERKFALVIGCAEYEYAGKLANPLNDAKGVEKSLHELGFDVMLLENPTLKELKIGIDEFGIELEKYDIGLFYFAGHGVQVKGLNYLIPKDANLKSERTVEYDCVRADRVLVHMEACKSDVNLIFLDACRNNPFERSWGRDISQRGLAAMDAPKGSLIAYSTSPGKTASDGEGDNGLYTGELIKELKAINISINQMLQKVRKQVMERSKDKQVPWESTSLTADFFFNKK